ncbi:hypothetical protein Tco_0792735 [Tanacetum coccineum]
MKKKSTDFVTPTKASGEAQEEEINHTILEAAKTLSKVTSQGVSKEKSTDKGKRYRRRARSVAKNINIGLDVEEEINTGIKDVNTGSTKVDYGIASKRGQREGKAPMIEEDIQATHKTKEQMRQEEARLEEDIKLQAQLDEEIDTFVPINLEATKAKLKRYEELQTKTSKKQRFDDKDVPAIGDKVDEVKEEEPVKRTRKRKKQKARKGVNVDKSAQDNSETDKEESIMRANGADTVYMSFGAMVKDFTREDLIELYRLVMQKYGTNRPKDAYDIVLWSDLRTMFDPPLNEDAIWSLPLQQKMSHRVHSTYLSNNCGWGQRIREILDECNEIVPSVKPISTTEDDENDEVATNQIEDKEDEEDIYDNNSDNNMLFDDIANE